MVRTNTHTLIYKLQKQSLLIQSNLKILGMVIFIQQIINKMILPKEINRLLSLTIKTGSKNLGDFKFTAFEMVRPLDQVTSESHYWKK